MRKLLLLLSIVCIVGCDTKELIVSVHDGDTYITDDGEAIRLKDADAPELKQPFGQEAKRFADSVLRGKEVIIKRSSHSYGRSVAEIEIDGVNFADLLVSNGLAHISYKYCRNAQLISEYEQAKREKKGLFSQSYILPYQFRHKN